MFRRLRAWWRQERIQYFAWAAVEDMRQAATLPPGSFRHEFLVQRSAQRTERYIALDEAAQAEAQERASP